MSPTYDRSDIAIPPEAGREPVVDTYHGTDVADPYRWLEDQHAPQTREWLDEQERYARAYLDALPYHADIRAKLAALSAFETTSEIRLANGRCFFLKLAPKAEQASLYMREGLWGKDALLLDPADLSCRHELSLSILAVSPDAHIVAVGLRTGGGGGRSIRFFDVNTQCLLRDEIPEGAIRGIAFLPANRGVFYVREKLPRGRHGKAARIHRLGESHEKDRVVYWAGKSDSVRLLGSVDGPSCTAIYHILQQDGRHVRHSVYLQRLCKCGAPLLALFEDTKYSLDIRIHNAHLFSRRSDGAILSTSLETPDFDNATLIYPASPAVSRWHLACDRLIIESAEDFRSVVRLFTLDGTAVGELPQPGPGTVRIVGSADHYIFFTWQSYSQPASLYVYDLDGSDVRPFSHEAPTSSVPIELRRSYATSSDGTNVPLTVLGRPNTFASAVPAPLLLTAYGAAGVSLTPQYSQVVTFVVEHGGLFAIAHTRGGGELGRDWQLAGQRRNRPNTHADFLACAEYLIAAGMTSARRLAIGGGSASGLLVAVAMTQRPELFRCVICIAPFLDMLRYHHYQNTQFYIDCFGTPQRDDDFDVLYSYSPYHHLHDGTMYPALLMIAGDRDTRCDSMHARKFVARLQAAILRLPNDRRPPVVLDYSASRGHHAVLCRSARISALTDRIAFLVDELGLQVHGAPLEIR